MEVCNGRNGQVMAAQLAYVRGVTDNLSIIVHTVQYGTVQNSKVMMMMWGVGFHARPRTRTSLGPTFPTSGSSIVPWVQMDAAFTVHCPVCSTR